MTKEKNPQLTTMTITVKKDLKHVLRIISKDMKVSTNQLVEVVLAQFVGGVVDDVRARKAKDEAEKASTETPKEESNG